MNEPARADEPRASDDKCQAANRAQPARPRPASKDHYVANCSTTDHKPRAFCPRNAPCLQDL